VEPRQEIIDVSGSHERHSLLSMALIYAFWSLARGKRAPEPLEASHLGEQDNNFLGASATSLFPAVSVYPFYGSSSF
jgi:hypothetical protein